MTESDATTAALRYAGRVRDGVEAHPATETLRRRYQAYRIRQGRDLLALIPRDGVRALVKAYRDEVGGAAPELDPLAAFAADRMPLPSFGIWLEDFHRHRGEHLALAEPPLADGPGAADGETVTVEVRSFQVGSEEWVASLAVHATDVGWRGAIHFHRPPETRSFTTTEIFRESDVTAVRERFQTLDRSTLQAFLRSVSP